VRRVNHVRSKNGNVISASLREGTRQLRRHADASCNQLSKGENMAAESEFAGKRAVVTGAE
jgi:hypothetical protein